VKRVLVLRLSALGDVIHTIPAVVALKEHARVAWVVEAPYRELVEIVAGVEAIPVRLKQWGRSPIASRGAMRDALRAMRGADTSIDFQGLVKSAMLGVFAGAHERIGFDRAAIREKPALLFTNRKVHVDTNKHVIEQNLELISAAPHPAFGHPLPASGERGTRGTPDARALLPARRGEGARRADEGPLHWEAFPADPENKLTAFANAIVLLPGAGKRNKLWPVERWREVARRTNAVVAWGPNERELADAIGGRVAPPTNLRELAWLLGRAQLVIGGDTGPLHLAAALGTKVVGLYGPTDPRRNGPYGQLDHCIDEFRATKCMESISVETVMNIAQRVAAE